MRIGNFEIQSISGGRFRLDGGAMFGVVPKPLWDRKSPANELNRIQLDTNCLCLIREKEIVLCDTGFGTKLSSKERMHLEASSGNCLVENLEKVGIQPEAVTHVIFSHLHFDHAGGATCFDSHQNLQLTFPNAVHVMQEQEKTDALGNAPELEGNYFVPELKFLFEKARCQTINGGAEIIPGIQVEKTGGHTAGHQAIRIEGEDRGGIYLGDLCPTTSHLNIFWTMAYDAFQLDVRRKKRALLNEIARDELTLFFDHDAQFQAANILRKSSTSFEVGQVLPSRVE
ncbi:MAG: MBL fold metallo-hydrolase [Pirellulaceae bacterium]|nr:MBL fold metallo-hydrolase [Pirellulaceae bacterium]